MRRNRHVTALVLCTVLSALLIGCGGGARYNDSLPAPQSSAVGRSEVLLSESYSYDWIDSDYYDSGVPALYAGAYGFGQEDSGQQSAQQQKIILEAELRMATDRFDDVSARMRGIAIENGGYVQNSEQYTIGNGMRRFAITIRVPYEQYEFVMAQIKDLCVLYSAHESQRNATAEYYDIQARLQTKLIEEERLLTLIDRTEKIEDILELESLLGRVRTQIEVYQTQMTSIDRLASYSTINVYLDEVIDELVGHLVALLCVVTWLVVTGLVATG